MTIQYINPPNVHQPLWGYSHAAVCGKTIYISAQLPLDIDGNLVGPGDPEAQARQVFQNLKYVLAASGASLFDVVKLTTYLTDLSYRPPAMEMRNEAFGTHRAPSILAIVSQLPVEGMLIEVDGIAVLD